MIFEVESIPANKRKGMIKPYPEKFFQMVIPLNNLIAHDMMHIKEEKQRASILQHVCSVIFVRKGPEDGNHLFALTSLVMID